MADSDETTSESTRPLGKGKGRTRWRPTAPRIKVEITAERIANSIKRDSRHCMISEAVKEAAPFASDVRTDVAFIRVRNPERRLDYHYATPKIAVKALVDWDEGIEIEPFTFTIGKATHITRYRGPDSNVSPEERQQRKAERQRRNDKIKRETVATEPDQFASGEHRARLAAAIKDPTLTLGPAIALPPSNGNRNSIPTLVGGRAPARYPQLMSTRKFGLREFGNRYRTQSKQESEPDVTPPASVTE